MLLRGRKNSAISGNHLLNLIDRELRPERRTNHSPICFVNAKTAKRLCSFNEGLAVQVFLTLRFGLSLRFTCLLHVVLMQRSIGGSLSLNSKQLILSRLKLKCSMRRLQFFF